MGNLTEKDKGLRRFGFSLGLGLMVITTILRLRGKSYFYLPYLSGLIVSIAFIKPGLLGPIKIFLEKVIQIITTFITWVLLLLLFYLIVTPIGLIARIFGKRFLKLGFEEINSYFEKRENGKAGKDIFERQF